MLQELWNKGLRVGKSLEAFRKKQRHSGFEEILSVLEHLFLKILSQKYLREDKTFSERLHLLQLSMKNTTALKSMGKNGMRGS